MISVVSDEIGRMSVTRTPGHSKREEKKTNENAYLYCSA